MTGGGFGYCAGDERFIGRGRRMGLGRGYGRGLRRGMGRGFARSYDDVPRRTLTKEEEKAYIQSDIKALEEELQILKKELEESSKEKK
jgi:hypothetical protein